MASEHTFTRSADGLERVSRAFREPFEVPGVEGYGAWSAMTWDNSGIPQHGLVLTPASAPWRGLFAALDRIGAGLSDGPVSALEEADAVVASCWRYGSFANVWASGEPYGEFRKDAGLSRFGNDEMMRVNLEFSSGLARWWLDRAAEPATVRRRVRATQTALPMPWRERRGVYADGVAELVTDQIVGEHLSSLAVRTPEGTEEDAIAVRREANYAVLTAYRNGPVEDYHAGDWSRGTEVPGYLRLTAAEASRLAGETASRLARHLALRERVSREGFRGLLKASWFFPRDWSVREETSPITFAGLPGAGPLEGRLERLADLAPRVYGRG
ncbi:hypothetical protein [uncultured Meiothermus sp.]|jgi:hypothetical protein|uniref:hypothetical protein n=1 Tax=uncultured Meiothermus sp. TaxID=157471 RepID=UPI0026293B9E|nr:hypothetical protein [uncultured Meiothermus sp.]